MNQLPDTKPPRAAGNSGGRICPAAAAHSAHAAALTEADTRAILLIFLAAITLVAMAMRVALFPIESGDYHQILHGWFTQLKEAGGLGGIGLEIGDYMPPYFYILALLTYLPVDDLVSIKLVSCIADILLASLVFRLVRLRWRSPSYAAAA